MNELLKEYLVKGELPNCAGYAFWALDKGPDKFIQPHAVINPKIAEIVSGQEADAAAAVLRDPDNGNRIYYVFHIVPNIHGSWTQVDHRPGKGQSIVYSDSLDHAFDEYARAYPRMEVVYLKLKE